MAHIEVLPTHLANLIAAGEVVERPASVAKELMENAIDAGATAVTVEISQGGLTYLRVTDNGKGIPPEELSTAFLRHATSKLRTQRDLEAIGTLGFRGEALAAISAVSRIEIMSKTEQGDFGASLFLDAGTPSEVEEAGCPLGTTIVVRDLFFNTPARLKFTKRDAAESAAVFATVQHIALSNPLVAVTFLRDGKQDLVTPGDGSLKSAVYAVLGRDLALGFVHMSGSGEDMSVSGFVSMPTCCRGSRNYQHFFVNDRYIKSRTMMAAVEEAYKNQKMVGKFPGCVVHLRMKKSAVDVNVHPAKTEVKFANERDVFQAVYSAVKSTLEGTQTRPVVTLTAPTAHDTVTQNQTELTRPTIAPSPVTLPLHDFSHKPKTWTPPQKNWSTPAPAPKPQTIPTAQPAPQTNPISTAMAEPVEKTAVVPPIIVKTTPPPTVAEKISPAVSIPVEPPLVEQAPWRVAGEVLNTYIIVEQGDTVLLIDKHAAHERMNFDRLKASDYQPMVQSLLAPAVIRPPAEELSVLLEHLSLLEEFGFDCEDFGGALLIRQTPFDVDIGEIEGILLHLAGRLLTTGHADPAGARDHLLHSMACKSAIKGGWVTSPAERDKIAQAVLSGAVKYCPHGRPVAIELTKGQLEKQFKRA